VQLLLRLQTPHQLIIVLLKEVVKTSSSNAQFGLPWVSVVKTPSTCNFIAVVLVAPVNVHPKLPLLSQMLLLTNALPQEAVQTTMPGVPVGLPPVNVLRTHSG